MSSWIEDGIAALEAMKGELDNALGTLRKLHDGQPKPAATLPPPLGARPPRKPRQVRAKPVRTPAASTPRQTGRVAHIEAPARVVSRATAPADLITERDAAILAHLKHGESTRGELVKIIPAVPGQTDEQRAGNCGNAIMRLKAKGKIRQTETGWALA